MIYFNDVVVLSCCLVRGVRSVFSGGGVVGFHHVTSRVVLTEDQVPHVLADLALSGDSTTNLGGFLPDLLAVMSTGCDVLAGDTLPVGVNHVDLCVPFVGGFGGFCCAGGEGGAPAEVDVLTVWVVRRVVELAFAAELCGLGGECVVPFQVRHLGTSVLSELIVEVDERVLRLVVKLDSFGKCHCHEGRQAEDLSHHFVKSVTAVSTLGCV